MLFAISHCFWRLTPPPTSVCHLPIGETLAKDSLSSILLYFYFTIFLFLYFVELYLIETPPSPMLLAHLPSDKFLDKFLEIIKGILEFLYFPQHTICRAPQWRSCLLSVVASVFSSANRARSFQLLSSSPKQHKPHRVLRRIALCIVFCIAVHWWCSVEAAASARTNN